MDTKSWPYNSRMLLENFSFWKLLSEFVMVRRVKLTLVFNCTDEKIQKSKDGKMFSNITVKVVLLLFTTKLNVKCQLRTFE